MIRKLLTWLYLYRISQCIHVHGLRWDAYLNVFTFQYFRWDLHSFLLECHSFCLGIVLAFLFEPMNGVIMCIVDFPDLNKIISLLQVCYCPCSRNICMGLYSITNEINIKRSKDRSLRNPVKYPLPQSSARKERE